MDRGDFILGVPRLFRELFRGVTRGEEGTPGEVSGIIFDGPRGASGMLRELITTNKQYLPVVRKEDSKEKKKGLIWAVSDGVSTLVRRI